MGVKLRRDLTLRSGPEGRVSKGRQQRRALRHGFSNDFLCGPSFETRPEGAPQDEVSS